MKVVKQTVGTRMENAMPTHASVHRPARNTAMKRPVTREEMATPMAKKKKTVIGTPVIRMLSAMSAYRGTLSARSI